MKSTVLLVSLAISCAGDTVLREVNRAGMRQKSVAMDAGSFTLAHVERFSRAELASKPRLNFIQLVMYGDKGGAPLPKPSHLTYEHWRGLHDSLGRSPNEIAEMVAIGNDAVLRMREANGNIRRRVLTGKDPLRIEIDGAHFEIVYVAFTAPSASILQRADVYVKTESELKVEAGLGLLGKLQPVFPDLELFLAIRNDAWFIYEPSYPFSNPFVEERNPPTAEECAKTRTLKCGRWSGAASCRFQ